MMATEIYLILGMALITFGIRYVLLAFAEKIVFPKLLKDSLNFIAPAVLTAITIPALILPDGKINVSIHNPYLVAGVLALVAGIYSKNVLLTILVGLSAFFIYQILI
ncbi:MAG: AzlD domain-containing protein [Aliifodinibius sp.]|nr:AzlD domain-containing protein [Fodinibius sp.]